MCVLLQLLYYSFSSLCNFDPICNIVIYFFLVLNFATVICVLSINIKLCKKKPVCSAAFLFWLFKFKAASFLESWFLRCSYGFVFQMPPRRSTRSKRPSSQALESLGASSPRRRRTAAPSLPSRGNDGETAAQSAVLFSGPFSHASEPAILATGPVFPPALFDQLVQRVAAEVTRQLQPASFLPAVQEPQCHLLPLLLFLVWPEQMLFNS